MKRAEEKGLGQETLSALQELDRRLHNDPLSFGEPLYTLKATQLQVRMACVGTVSVLFALDEERRLVYVVAPIKPAPGYDY